MIIKFVLQQTQSIDLKPCRSTNCPSINTEDHTMSVDRRKSSVVAVYEGCALIPFTSLFYFV